MVKYSCENCQSVFAQKGHLEAHKNRKRPCKKDNTIEALVEKKVQEVLSKTNEGAVKIEATTMSSVVLQQMDYNTKTIPELKELCKQRKIKGISGKSKADLVKLLDSSSPVAVVSTSSAPTNETTLNLNDMINKVSYGECVNMMKKIPANSIDMVCTDPPYFLDGLGDEWNKESLDNKGSSAVVGNLPKGMKFDRNQSKRFNEFYSKVSVLSLIHI